MDDDVIARLRRGISEIESTGTVDKDAAAAARKARRDLPPPQLIPRTYPGLPEGDDWMGNVPAKYRHGENGFDRRLMEDLANAGFRCYTFKSPIAPPRKPSPSQSTGSSTWKKESPGRRPTTATSCAVG
ncbi:hypothetical protein AWC31_32715 [Mycolicibacterium wolinskyi]|uniref:Uncharacterized protein n=2 Tax=Mycobacteriaceae TaxID=1762 RepID=A0A1X2F0B3_9MYCO|nr:hypothetical protein AWC31_32715 [Mycolicibacterium wolinskyi]